MTFFKRRIPSVGKANKINSEFYIKTNGFDNSSGWCGNTLRIFTSGWKRKLGHFLLALPTIVSDLAAAAYNNSLFTINCF
jgi:hypothetical protein